MFPNCVVRKNWNQQSSRQVERREQLMELSVNWGSVAKISDVVVLKEPIEAPSEKVFSAEPYAMNITPKNAAKPPEQ